MRQSLAPLSLLTFTIAGCQSMPTVTRSGEVKEIFIRDKLSSSDLQVNVGDEIRWINKRMAPVRIVFLDPVVDKLSCKHNFGGMFQQSDKATLSSNGSASVCFHGPGTVRYTVRMDSARPNGEVTESARIHIEALPGQQSVGEEPHAMTTTGS